MKEVTLASELEVLEFLEERVRRAADLVRSLKRENLDLKSQIQAAEQKHKQALESIASLEEQHRRGDDVRRQLQLLQEERQEIRGRVTRMLETFAAMEEIPSSGHPDN
jgi:small-conductance mechanosensitive channel